jgi:hypothetical protein
VFLQRDDRTTLEDVGRMGRPTYLTRSPLEREREYRERESMEAFVRTSERRNLAPMGDVPRPKRGGCLKIQASLR